MKVCKGGVPGADLASKIQQPMTELYHFTRRGVSVMVATNDLTFNSIILVGKHKA